MKKGAGRGGRCDTPKTADHMPDRPHAWYNLPVRWPLLATAGLGFAYIGSKRRVTGRHTATGRHAA